MTGNTPPRKFNAEDLANSITELLQAGILVSDDVMHYIDSTFLNPTIDEFREILADVSNCEAETAIELIFYPDLKMQKTLEPALKKTDYSETDVESAIRCLAKRAPTVTVTFPDGRGSVQLQPAESTLRQFVTRLKIAKKMDVRLADTLSRVITDEADILGIRVMLRNSRKEFSESAISFLCTYVEKMAAASDFFDEALMFLIDFFEYTDPGQNIYHHLMREKKTLLAGIAKAEKNQKAMETNSMELLMLRGVNFLTIDMAETRKKISLIDHICLSIFGKTKFFDPAGQPPPSCFHTDRHTGQCPVHLNQDPIPDLLHRLKRHPVRSS